MNGFVVETIRQKIADFGIVGAGGAGFPTHVKLNSQPEYVILNAAECEPLLHKDKELLLHHTDSVLNGMQTVMQLTGARQGIVAVKEKYKELISYLKPELNENLMLCPIGDFYPAGDEFTLVYLTTGRVVQPGQLPVSQGCVVQNVETVMNIGLGRPVVDTFFTVAGAVKEPATVSVPVGTLFQDVLAQFEITTRNYVIRAGGLMMGWVQEDLEAPVTKTTGGLIVLPSDHHCVTMYNRFKEPQDTIRIARAGCDQCNFCTEFCPRYLLGHPVRPETAMRNRMFSPPDEPAAHLGNAFCCECNLCTMYACPESLDPTGSTVIEKRILRQDEKKWEGLPVKPHPMMDYRKVPTKKLMQRLDVLQFNNTGPLTQIDFAPSRVNIPLKQHIGAPAVPVVSKGDKVSRFDQIAKAQGEISAPVHASIDGVVTEVNDVSILIQRSV